MCNRDWEVWFESHPNSSQNFFNLCLRNVQIWYETWLLCSVHTTEFLTCLLLVCFLLKKWHKEKQKKALVRTFHKMSRRTFNSRTGTCKTKWLFSPLTWNSWYENYFFLAFETQKLILVRSCKKWTTNLRKMKICVTGIHQNLTICSGDF